MIFRTWLLFISIKCRENTRFVFLTKCNRIWIALHWGKSFMNKLKRRRVKRREKEDFIKMKSIFCVWLWLWMAMWKKKWNWVSLISTEVQLFRFALPAQQRWFCSCETKWDFYAKDIEDICNCIYSEPFPLCDFYLASCDISLYGRSTRGKMVDYSSQLTLNPFHSNDLIWRIFLSFSFERKR